MMNMNVKLILIAGALVFAATASLPTAAAESDINCNWSGGGAVKEIYIATCNAADDTCEAWLGDICSTSGGSTESD